jgi:hypothetical protein
MSEHDDKKIHIDEDWKAKVAAEREMLAAQEKMDQDDRERPPLPPASLATLISNFATQALIGLGRLPGPGAEKPEIDLEMARYAIDMIEVLEQKTAGNVDETETQLMRTALDDLRMAYLNVAKAAATTGTGSTPAEQGGTSRIITP